jgi:hypothetical protein
MFLGQPVTGQTLGYGGGAFRYPIVIPLQFALQVAGAFQGTFISTSNFCQIANAGIELIVTFLDQNGDPLDISGATVLAIGLQAPDDTLSLKTAQYVTNGIDGKIYYVLTATDILETGLWYCQGQVTVGGAILTTALGQFEAQPNL